MSSESSKFAVRFFFSRRDFAALAPRSSSPTREARAMGNETTRRRYCDRIRRKTITRIL